MNIENAIIKQLSSIILDNLIKVVVKSFNELITELVYLILEVSIETQYLNLEQLKVLTGVFEYDLRSSKDLIKIIVNLLKLLELVTLYLQALIILYQPRSILEVCNKFRCYYNNLFDRKR